MNFRKFIGLGGLMAVLVAGIWLVSSSSQLGLETTDRRNAVRQLAAVSGVPGVAVDSNAFYEANQGPVVPVAVNMADVAIGEPDPNNLYEAWLAGEVDLNSEGLLAPAEMAALRQAALSLPPDAEVQQLQEAVGGNTNLSMILDFDSMDFQTGSNGSTPPDPELAAGPNFVIAVVNTSFEIYDKSGNVVRASTSFSSFLSGSQCPGVFDPVVVYDEEHDRYVMGVDADGAFFCLAISDTEDALGSWNVYSFSVGNGGTIFMDYPHIGVGQDAIFMGGNIFNLNVGSFVESRVWAFDKNDMYAGVAADFTTVGINDGSGTPFPLNMHGDPTGWSSNHFIATDPYDGETLEIREWVNPLGGGALNIAASINVATETGVATGQPVSTPQNGGSDIQANDWRSRDFEFFEDTAYWTDSVSCNPGAGTVNCVRWAQFDLTGTPSFIQGGVIASDGEYRIFPNLAVNSCGDMVVGYTKSSPSTLPSIYVAGREAGDPAGVVQPEILMKAGEVPYRGFDSVPRRFGDYTGMYSDPDGFTFWYLGEYSKDIPGSTTWGTYIASFSFPECQLDFMTYQTFLPAIPTP